MFPKTRFRRFFSCIFALVVGTLLTSQAQGIAAGYSEEHFRTTIVSSLPDLTSLDLTNPFANPGTMREVGIPGSPLYVNTLGPCDKVIPVSCIASVWAKETNGSWIQGQYRGMMFEPKDQWLPDIARDLGSPRTSNLFIFPGLSHLGGNLFAVNPQRQYQPKISTEWQCRNYRPKEETFKDCILRYSKVSEANQEKRHLSTEIFPVEETADLDRWGDYLPVTGRSTYERCVQRRSPCWRQSDTQAPLEFRIELLTGFQPPGWLSGRMVYPSVKITPTGSPEKNRKYRVVIEGRQAAVPQIVAKFDFDKSDERVAYQKFAEQTRLYCPVEFYVDAQTPNGLSTCFQPRTEMWSKWEKWLSPRTGNTVDRTYLNRSDYQVHNLIRPSDIGALVEAWPQADSAFEERNLWGFSWNGSPWEGWLLLKGPKSISQPPNKCEDINFYGTSFSNSTTQNFYLPQWNGELAALEMIVASPHFSSRGTENVGFYEFSISEKIARCAWGLGDKPLSLSATIIDGSGSSTASLASVATKDGFLKFSFTGFTYSVPKLQIRISEKSSAVCKKGKSRMNLRQSRENCPRGWAKVTS